MGPPFASRPSQDRPVPRGETDSQALILRLQDEVERLKKRVAEQDDEITKLKRGAGLAPRPNPGP
jgi:hypothetical protein